VTQSGGLPGRVAGGGVAAFVLMGAITAIYGTAVPELRDRFHLGAASAGLLLSANFCGSVTGILAAGFTGDRIRASGRLAGALGVSATGCLGFGLAPVWPLALCSAFVIGFGLAVIDLDFNRLFAAGFGARSAAFTNLLHAGYGAGAILGPIGVGLAGGAGFRLPVLVIAGLLFVVLPAALAAPASSRPPAAVRAKILPGLSWALLGFMAVYLLYAGAEASTGGWEPTHLVDAGHSRERAAQLTSLFWAALTAGRLLNIPISLRVRPSRLATGSLVLAAGCLALAEVRPIAPLAYALAGLAFGPFFPTGLVWLLSVVPGSRLATTGVFLAANIGGIALPALIGLSVSIFGPRAIPVALSLPMVVAFLIGVTLLRVARRRETC